MIAELCRRHDALVISDEVYSEIMFDGAAHVPIATLPEMCERTITIDSMGKTFSVTGWKVGWAIAPAPLTAALRAVHQFVTFTNSRAVPGSAGRRAAGARPKTATTTSCAPTTARRRDLLARRAARLRVWHRCPSPARISC